MMMVVTTNTSHYLQCLDITNEGKYNGTCMPLFNFVIAPKKYKNITYNEHMKACLNIHNFQVDKFVTLLSTLDDDNNNNNT